MNPDCIHYKIFLCAAGYEPEIRRITVDKDICHNYFYLKQKVLAIFPTLKDVAFTISWKDSEGDNIRICTDDELVIALKEMESNEFKKIYVNASPQGKEGPVHPDVICDGCENALHGFRYKCLVCLDYDLCPDCERSQMHPDHPMIRIPVPLSSEMPFGRRFARDIAKMGKHFERLLHQTTDHMGDKKARGDYSSSSRCGGSDNRKHKMKFCPRNDVQNFLHNLLYSHLEKMTGSASGDSNAAPNSPRPENTEPQASTSGDGNPILEEQKKFVNILTSGLNSFLDPLGIDLIVEEDHPVKEESPQKRPQSNLSENGSKSNKTSLDGDASTSQITSNFAASAAAPIVTQPGMTQTQPSLLINTDPVPPIAVDAPVSQPLSNTTAPVSVASSSRTQPQLASATVGVQPSAFGIGVPPPASMVGSQSSATVGTQPSPSIGFQLPATIGVPPPMTIGVGITPSVAIGAQPLPKVNVGAQVPVSNPGVPVMAAASVQTHINPNPTPQPQMVSPTHSYQDEIPILDSSWTIVNDGMGESILVQQPSSNEASALPPQNTQETERIYPQLVTSALMSTEEAMKIMEQLGFKNEEWLRQLIDNKKGNIQEVLNFLSPIPKPKPSTNLS